MKRIIVVLLIVFASLTYGESEKKNENESKIDELIKNNTKLELEVKNLVKQYGIEKTAIRNEYQEKLNEIISEKNELKTKFNILMFIFGILGGGSILGIFIFINNTKNKLYKKMAEELRVKKDLIENSVKKHDTELKLKKTKKICVLSVDDENKGEITQILESFEGREYKRIEEEIDFNNYDLILINNNAEYEIKKINKILKDNSNTLFFYYGGVPTKRGLKNVNFSNSPFTLYGNLIDTLRTQDLLNK